MSLSGECAVCLRDLSQHDNACSTKCGHVFHMNCISQWIQVSVQHSKCLYCCRQHQHVARANKRLRSVTSDVSLLGHKLRLDGGSRGDWNVSYKIDFQNCTQIMILSPVIALLATGYISWMCFISYRNADYTEQRLSNIDYQHTRLPHLRNVRNRHVRTIINSALVVYRLKSLNGRRCEIWVGYWHSWRCKMLRYDIRF